MSNPLTLVGIILGGTAVTLGLSWLFDPSRTANTALSGGNGPNLGGAPLPPPLNPTQAPEAIPQAPTEGAPVPTLEEILENAGYSQEEQAAQAAAPELPPCPPEVLFVLPQNSRDPSATRTILNNGATGGLCDGPPPRAVVQPISRRSPRYLCRDQESQRITTGCTIHEADHQCPPEQQLEQCSGLQQSESARAAGWACVRARALGSNPVIVLEHPAPPHERGLETTESDRQLFESELLNYCDGNTEIYSESAPFTGASQPVRNHVQFGSTPADILRRRTRAEYMAQRAAQQAAAATEEPAPETAPQETTEDGAQGATNNSQQQESEAANKPSNDAENTTK
ncbi:MAG: hypothetical protein ACRC1U_05945 [Vibrionaceae bacterium]